MSKFDIWQKIRLIVNSSRSGRQLKCNYCSNSEIGIFFVFCIYSATNKTRSRIRKFSQIEKLIISAHHFFPYKENDIFSILINLWRIFNSYLLQNRYKGQNSTNLSPNLDFLGCILVIFCQMSFQGKNPGY